MYSRHLSIRTSTFYIRVNICASFLYSSLPRMQQKCAVDSWKGSKAKSVSPPWLFVTVKMFSWTHHQIVKPKSSWSIHTWQTQSTSTHNTMHYKAHIVSTHCTLISWTKHSLAHIHTNTPSKPFFLLTPTETSVSKHFYVIYHSAVNCTTRGQILPLLVCMCVLGIFCSFFCV